ncbi:serine hydrolase domain-containing protein [Kribbella sp. NPDC026611]|uniref:serine hydrolase domain-containing protein n=1 Tax=Kribbella sp. NPDC026611 TaxID=3154911 RepID=UPI0033C768DE
MGTLRAGIEADLEKFNVPGASWVVFDDSCVVETGTAGVLAVGESQAVVPGTLFQACSISKPVAVLGMLRLVDRGLLDLDEDVNHKLTSWQLPSTNRWQPTVTPRLLASHSAGTTVSGFPGYSHDDVLPTAVEILNGVAPANNIGVRVDIMPGTQFRYSGGGTTVVQQLMEDVTGTPFRELMRELVLEPLGMSDSDYAQPLPTELHDRAAIGHDDLGVPLDEKWDIYPQLAAAGLWTTPTDLAKFAGGVRRAYGGDDGGLVSARLATEMLTPQIESTSRTGGLSHLGLGVFVGDGGRRFGHSGSNVGYCCHLLTYRDSGQGAVVMTNGDAGGWVVRRAFAAAAATYGWDDYPMEVELPEAPSEELLTTLAGRYRLESGPRFTVRRWGSGLEVVFDGQLPMRFGAASATSFTAESLLTDLEVQDKELVLHQDGAELRCARE